MSLVIPTVSDPEVQQALNQIQLASPGFALNRNLPVNVLNYGAKGDGTTGDGAAINAAIDSLSQTGNARGGAVSFPPGRDYLVDDEAVNAIDKAGVVLQGMGGATQHQPRLLLTTATGSAVTAGGSQGFAMRNLRVHASSSSYTGDLVDFGPDGSQDASLATVEDCWISGVSGGTGRLLVLDSMTEAYVRGCSFQHGNYGIVGYDGGFCNTVLVEGNTFNFMVLGNIRNPHQGWSIRGNSMEPLADGSAGGISNDFAVLTSMGVVVESNWFGDVSGGTGTWIDLKANGLSVHGNFLESPQAGGTYIKLRQCEGFSVVGNKFNGAGTGVDFVTATCSGGFIGANDFQGVGTEIANEANALQLTVAGNDGQANFTVGLNASTDYSYGYYGNALEVRIGAVNTQAGVLMGSGGDAWVSRQQAAVVHVEKALHLSAIAAGSVPNNSIFMDSADNIIKVKDNAGAVTAI